jgi:hypothetical protein
MTQTLRFLRQNTHFRPLKHNIEMNCICRNLLATKPALLPTSKPAGATNSRSSAASLPTSRFAHGWRCARAATRRTPRSQARRASACSRERNWGARGTRSQPTTGLTICYSGDENPRGGRPVFPPPSGSTTPSPRADTRGCEGTPGGALLASEDPEAVGVCLCRVFLGSLDGISGSC